MHQIRKTYVLSGLTLAMEDVNQRLELVNKQTAHINVLQPMPSEDWVKDLCEYGDLLADALEELQTLHVGVSILDDVCAVIPTVWLKDISEAFTHCRMYFSDTDQTVDWGQHYYAMEKAELYFLTLVGEKNPERRDTERAPKEKPLRYLLSGEPTGHYLTVWEEQGAEIIVTVPHGEEQRFSLSYHLLRGMTSTTQCPPMPAKYLPEVGQLWRSKNSGNISVINEITESGDVMFTPPHDVAMHECEGLAFLKSSYRVM